MTRTYIGLMAALHIVLTTPIRTGEIYQPNNRENQQDCEEMATKENKWNDRRCSLKRHSVLCQKPAISNSKE